MANNAIDMQDTSISIAEGSDYGSDLDEATVDALFSHTSPVAVDNPEAPTILDDHGDERPLARLAKIRQNLHEALAGLDEVTRSLRPEALQRDDSTRTIEIEYDGQERSIFSPPPPDANQQRRREQAPEVPIPEEQDDRSPLLRFRTPPKKCLSVTDLISPAWCELQYFYNLSKYGRVKRTKAMKQGSSVHKVLEEQVHTEVPVDVVTKEDKFALRLWNVIQGLRTLRQTGMTREMEVWGVVEGEVVNGVVDQITTTCPDVEAEGRMLEDAEGGREDSGKVKALEQDQRTLTQYFAGPQQVSILEKSGSRLEQNGGAWLGTLQEERERPTTFYIVDVKTRQSKTLPPSGSQTRPTHYQLMMYHRLFTDLASNSVPADRIFARYDVDPNLPFSDTFIAQMSSLSLEAEDIPSAGTEAWDAPSQASSRAQDPLDVLLAHNTLTTLWTLMIQKYTHLKTSPTTTISPLLTAEFRSSSSGDLLGRKHFLFSAEQLQRYISDELSWWRGERQTKGVEVEEAYKCRLCEFVEGCTWRKEKVEEGVRRARVRKEGKTMVGQKGG
ncbi:hypothetical protein LTR78_007931 [Recurvomyces mirabilis]|uniref:Exonuclease V n=1 Tax=Recurvomyces mirabilis TaxID=574656 RepID=A0AAE0TRW3_9PEZI|nr:hypothetical protein LTR78_007931 [Recurvomyces mirabilis]KAK5152466.1 hypothetical protein LTS14_008413 [Recurvomyces mirabilis]